MPEIKAPNLREGMLSKKALYSKFLVYLHSPDGIFL